MASQWEARPPLKLALPKTITSSPGFQLAQSRKAIPQIPVGNAKDAARVYTGPPPPHTHNKLAERQGATHQRRSFVSSGWNAVASKGPCLTATATLLRPPCAADSSARSSYSARTSTCSMTAAAAGRQ